VEKRLRSPLADDPSRFSDNSKRGKEIDRQNNLAGESAIFLAARQRADPAELTSSAKPP
jgi:hypothetical protein